MDIDSEFGLFVRLNDGSWMAKSCDGKLRVSSDNGCREGVIEALRKMINEIETDLAFDAMKERGLSHGWVHEMPGVASSGSSNTNANIA